jgi:hypothetical protein
MQSRSCALPSFGEPFVRTAVRSIAPAVAATLALAAGAAAQTAPEALPQPAPTQVVALVKVPKPWYAPKAYVIGKFRDAVPQYDAVPGLQYKYFTLSDDGTFGGLYLWNSRTQADGWFNDAWHARVLKERGVRGDVTLFDAPVVLDNMLDNAGAAADGQAVATIVRIPIPAGVGRERLIAEFNKALPTYQAVPGLARKYFIITQDGKFGGVYLWTSRAAAQTFYSAAWHERVRATYGSAADVAWFDAPVVLPSRLQQTTVSSR